MAKISTYDFNRSENSLTVVYESGTVRNYPVDCTPKSVQTFICEDIVFNIISDILDRYESDRRFLIPSYRNSCICSDTHLEISKKLSIVGAKINFLRDLNSCSFSEICDEIRSSYSYYLQCSSSKDECILRFHDFFNACLCVINELCKSFGFSPDDSSFVLTFEYLLSIKFHDNSVPDTAEQPDDTSELETVEHSESETVETAESEQSEDTLYEWANSLTEIQRDYLFNGGWYNHTVRSYLVAAALEAGFTREQTKELLNGLRFAFSTKDKSDVEKLFEDWQGGEYSDETKINCCDCFRCLGCNCANHDKSECPDFEGIDDILEDDDMPF